MFQKFTAALLEKIISFLQSHPDFFSDKNRSKTLEKLSLPKSFVEYLTDVSEKQFLKDVELASIFAKSGYRNVSLRKNGFFNAMAQFLTNELVAKLDFLDSEIALMKEKEKREVAAKLIKGESTLAKSLRDILSRKTYQQIASAIFKLAQNVDKTPYLLVQSPREIDLELKREIRESLSETAKNSFPIFQINRKLVGGLRIFEDGKSLDHSWLSKVQYFTSLTN
jgi:F0F1-type ATP synthase delta subunit